MDDMPTPPRKRFIDSWAIRGGVFLLVIGSGPLFAIILAAQLGLTRDPNPNPIGPGMLAGWTFLPSVVLILAGLLAGDRNQPEAAAAIAGMPRLWFSPEPLPSGDHWLP
jgi:hypothetical protein